MIYTFAHNQANALLESLDITVKKLGIKGVYSITELAHLIWNPKEETDTHYVYEISDDQVTAFREVLDITVKEIGLKGAVNILEITEVFNNPTAESAIQEELPAEEAAK